MGYDTVFKNNKDLHRFTFNNVVKVNGFNDEFSLTPNFYAFEDYIGKGEYHNGRFKNGVSSCCTLCNSDAVLPKEDNWNKNDKENYDKYYKDYRLKYVSHGSHTIDFLNAAGMNNSEISKLFINDLWDETPVLFLMENPSIDYEIYCPCSNGKSPTNTWYWIHREKPNPKSIIIDDYLKQGIYGDMVYAIICKYKLANAYLTNAIKCGLNGFKNGKDDYVGSSWYSEECKNTCLKSVLSKEIDILTNGYNRLKVFAFGSNAYWLAKKCFEKGMFEYKDKNIQIQLVQLPHPSSRIKNLYRGYAIKGIVSDIMCNNEQYKLE